MKSIVEQLLEEKILVLEEKLRAQEAWNRYLEVTIMNGKDLEYSRPVFAPLDPYAPPYVVTSKSNEFDMK